MRESRYAGVIATHADRIVLVRERQPWWGGEFWNIPSGGVEDHETPAAGAVRELAEETGLVVPADRLRLIGTSRTDAGDRRSLAWNFTADVDGAGLAVADPDRSVLEARWFPVEEAVDLLARLPYRPIAEPVVAYLRGAVGPGWSWTYPTAGGEPLRRPPAAG